MAPPRNPLAPLSPGAPRALRALALAALAALSPLAASCNPDPKPAPSIPLSPCQLSTPGLPRRAQATCGTVTVFEDRKARTGRTIPLHVAVVEATGAKVEPDPLFILAGGPGQAATEIYAAMEPMLARVNERRDIVLVDQRGTGRSNPLSCPLDPTVDATLVEPAQREALARACLEKLTGDPRLYTTPIAMDDLDDVRAALGYERINLLGISYGTRAALVYLRQHPDRVRTVTLDAVAPMGFKIMEAAARDAERALSLNFEACAKDPACKEAFPEPRQDFDAVMARLARPEEVELRHPATGERTRVKLDRATLASAIRILSYGRPTAALFPLLFHAARATGDLGPLAAQVLLVQEGSVLKAMSWGMFLSVICAEDVPFIDAKAGAAQAAGTYVGDAPIAFLQDTCRVWPRGEVAPDYHAPVTSDAPVLVLSGELDPITPPANGDQAARTLRRARHIVVPGEGHNVVGTGCVPRLFSEFVEQGAAEGLDDACVKAHRPAPFFTSFRGPRP